MRRIRGSYVAGLIDHYNQRAKELQFLRSADRMILKMAGDAFSRVELASLEGRAQSTRYRQTLFHNLYRALHSSEATIKDAIRADTGHNESEVTLEYALSVAELRTHYESVSLQADLKSQRSLEDRNATTNVGIIYVVPTKQNLFYSVISILTVVLAAGNCLILEVCQHKYFEMLGSLTRLSSYR